MYALRCTLSAGNTALTKNQTASYVMQHSLMEEGESRYSDNWSRYLNSPDEVRVLREKRMHTSALGEDQG